MRAILLFIYGVPALLLAIFVAAFINSTNLTSAKKNEFMYGNIGEASKLNPILYTDQTSGDVCSLVFEGLMTMDEKLELKPKLAKTFNQSQVTTFLFVTPEAAQAGEEKLNAAAASWGAWTLKGVKRDGAKLELSFDMPGYHASEEIAGLFDPASLLPLTTFRMDLSGSARKTLEQLKAARQELLIARQWFDFDSAFEVTIAGDADAAETAIKEFLKTTGDAKAAVARTETRSFIAEPILRFQLRDDVKWHDGAPFTSEDCVFTYDSLVSEQVASPRKPDFDVIQKVEAPSPHEFVVTYRKPYSPALLSWSMGLLPSHILKGKDQAWWSKNFNRRPVGTGAFKFDTWKTNEYLRVVKNPDYWDYGPWLDAFVFRTMPDPTTLRLAFETHQLDIYELTLAPWALRSFEKDPRFQVDSASAFAYSYIGWNLRREMFKDVRVRTALAHAVNVPQLIEFVNYGNGQQSTGIFIPEFWFADKTIKPIEYDPEKARRMLDEAGWKVGPDGIRAKDGQKLEFKIITNQGNDVRKDIATLVQDSLRTIGVKVTIEIYEWAVFIERFINKHEFDANVLGWTTPPDWDVYQVWHSSQTGLDQLNHVGYASPEADKLIVQLREEYDRDKIKELASRLQRRIYEDQPVMFLNVPNAPVAIWKDAFRIRRKTENGEWVDTPFRTMPGGWEFFLIEMYRPEYADLLPKESEVRK